MKSLTLQLVNGKERRLQSVSWKTPKDGDCHRQFYALDENNKPLVVTLKPAGPEFWTPGFAVVLNGEPFPEMVCVEISPCRLLPPPCFQSREEFENQRQLHSAFDPWCGFSWCGFYLQTHGQALILQPADDGPLQARLDQWLVKARQAYEYEANGWRGEITRLETSTLEQLQLTTEDERAKRLKEARERLDWVESDTPIDGVPCKGRLKLTLEGVKRGEEGIRDNWMEEDWAKKNNVDLQQMGNERLAFRKWLQAHTGTPANTPLGIWPPHFGEHAENNPQFLVACAKVRYRARFADYAGTVVYLADCELNEEPSVPELEEVERLLGTADPQVITSDERLPLDVVLQKLGTDWKKKGLVAMGVPGFKKLCDREGIKFEEVQKRGLKRGILDKLLKKRASQIRKRKSHLEKHNKSPAAHDKPTGSMHDESEAPDEGRIKVGGSLAQLESKLRAIGEKKA